MADSMGDFDFDYWCDLAKRDPAAFFAARERVINDFIASVPAKYAPDLHALQNLIDGTRAEAGTPMKAVQQMMGMLGDHLEALQSQLLMLHHDSQQLAASMVRMRD